jgi:hypothetical protein
MFWRFVNRKPRGLFRNENSLAPKQTPKKPYKKIRRACVLLFERLRVFTKIKIEGLG